MTTCSPGGFLNVLIFSEPTFPRHPGGAGKSTHVLAAELVRRGHRVAILCECQEADELEIIDGVHVHRLNTDAVKDAPRSTREVETANHCLRYIEERLDPARLDLLYDSGGFLSFFFRVARSLKARFGVPYLIHYRYLVAHDRQTHENDTKKSLSAQLLGLDTLIPETTQCVPARFADLTVCPSRFQADFVEHQYRPASGPVRVLPEPIDLTRPDAERVRAWRAEFAAPEARLIFFGGRIDSHSKNPRLVARAFAAIRTEEPNARLVLPVKTPGVPKEFQSIEHAVLTLPWVTDRSLLATALASMDIGLVPSTYESFGLMCAELLAVGTPVIGSAVGAMPELIQHGRNGFLLAGEPGEGWVQQIADYCLTLLRAPSPETMRAAARNSTRRYSIETVGALAEELCELAVASRTPARNQFAAPRFSPEDEAHYLRVLHELSGRAALEPASRVIAHWPATANDRCSECTRSRLANGHIGLRANPIARAWGALRGRLPSSVARSIEDVCPLGLVQRTSPKQNG